MKKKTTVLVALVLALILVTSQAFAASNTSSKGSKTGVFYEIFVRTFVDTNKDGVGDLKGVIKKLDYLQGLGVRGIWLMPITDSPSGHGYDTTDYYKINPQYGTMADLKKLTKEAHKRNIKIIMDLVVNHTSNEHPWFIDASTDANSKYRDYYTFAKPGQDTSNFNPWGGEIAWHVSPTGLYKGVFNSSMPDLNFDNPAVRTEIKNIGKYWLKNGIDGFRLDAAKHIYEDFEESKEDPNTAKKNVAWWQEFRASMNEVNKKAMLVGEIWDDPAVVAPYLNNALNSGFNFKSANLIIQSINDGYDSTDFVNQLTEIYNTYKESSKGTYVDAPFLSNHDQTRVMSALNGDKKKAKLAASILMTLPGNPFMYYGEEIGMKGLKEFGDEALRTPMKWTKKKTKEQTTIYETNFTQSKSTNVQSQIKDKDSLLSFYKKVIKTRNKNIALSDGSMQAYKVNKDSVLSWTRDYKNKHVLVLHNLGEKKVVVTINKGDLRDFKKIMSSTVKGAKINGNKVTIPAYGTATLK